MIETTKQRRWWFATHSQYGWNRATSAGDRGHKEKDVQDVK